VVAVERQDEGSRASLRPQAQVHAEGVALVGDRLHRRHHRLGRLGEVLPVGDGAPRAAARLPVVAVDEDEVDVGGVVELVAAELAHADDGEAGAAAIGGLGNAIERLQRLVRPAAGGAQAHVGEPRQLLGGYREVGVAQDIAGADAEELAVLEAA
jgi:hypothetical protein